MFSSYLKTILRNTKRYKVYTFINIFGLSIGLASAIFIFLWVADEVSFDNFHVDSDDIYIVLINQSYPDGRIEAQTSQSLISLIKRRAKNEHHTARSRCYPQLNAGGDILYREHHQHFIRGEVTTNHPCNLKRR